MRSVGVKRRIRRNYGSVQTYQINNSNVFANTNATVQNVNGNIDASAAAIGNTAQIVHY